MPPSAKALYNFILFAAMRKKLAESSSGDSALKMPSALFFMASSTASAHSSIDALAALTSEASRSMPISSASALIFSTVTSARLGLAHLRDRAFHFLRPSTASVGRGSHTSVMRSSRTATTSSGVPARRASQNFARKSRMLSSPDRSMRKVLGKGRLVHRRDRYAGGRRHSTKHHLFDSVCCAAQACLRRFRRGAGYVLYDLAAEVLVYV